MKTKAIKTILKKHNREVKSRQSPLFTRKELLATVIVAIAFWELGRVMTDAIINLIK